MEDLAKPVALNHEMVETLDQIRAGAENALYGASPAQAEELFKKHVASMIVGSGMPALQVMHYQWFLRELARLWRTRKGRDLAFHIELTIRKWLNLGLEPRTLQFLICEAHQRLKAIPANSEVRNQNAETRSEDVRPEAEQSVESAKSADVRSDTTPSATSASSAVDRSGTEQSVESVKSVDVRSGPGPDTGILESSTPGPLSPDIETAKDGKIAKSEPDSDTRPLESSIPGPLSSSTPGPLSHSTPGVL